MADSVLTPCTTIKREVAYAKDREPGDDAADTVTVTRVEAAAQAAKSALAAVESDSCANPTLWAPTELEALRTAVADATAEADAGLSLCFSPRTAASRRYLRVSIDGAKADAAATADAIRTADAKYSINGVPTPSLPGARPRGTSALSVSALKQKLQELEVEDLVCDVVVAASSPPRRHEADDDNTAAAGTAVVAVDRAGETDDTRSAALVPAEEASGTQHSSPSWAVRAALHDYSVALQSTFRALPGERLADNGVLLAPHGVRPTATHEAERTTRVAMDADNAREDYRGFQREVQRTTARLGLVAGIDFVLVPEATYELGAPEHIATNRASSTAFDRRPANASLYKVTGSDGPSARLDERSRWFLEAGYGDPDGPVEGAPRDREYGVGPQRCVALDAFLVSERPVTVGQYRRLLKDRRFRGMPRVPDAMLRPHHHRRLFLRGVPEGVVVEPLSDAVLPPDTENEPLCVPYFVAEDIAAAVGCAVASFDVHEAAMRGVEGYDVPYSQPQLQQVLDGSSSNNRGGAGTPEDGMAVVAADAEPESQACGTAGPIVRAWSVDVEDGRRSITGCSTLVAREALATVRDRVVRAPTGAKGMLTRLGEWCSGVALTSDVRGLTTHAVRSFTDYGTQFVEHGRLEHDAGFVGFTAASYCGPRDGHVTAGFRLAMPARQGGAERWALALEAAHRGSGRHLAFEALVRGLGAAKDDWFAAFGPGLRADATTLDPLYGDQVEEFRSAGFDAVFSAEYPHAAKSARLHCRRETDHGPSSLPGPLLPFAERRAFAYPVPSGLVGEVVCQEPAAVQHWADLCRQQCRGSAEEVRLLVASTVAVKTAMRRTVIITPKVRGAGIDQIHVSLVCEEVANTQQ